MHRLFEEWVAEAPGAPAVSAGGVGFTYAELNAWAERLARHLRRLGIRPESLTALLLERSPELIVSALATFKAGGAYLPIDPAQPAERVDYIVSDSGAGVLVTTAPILRRFPGLSAPGGVVLLEQVPDEGGGPLAGELGPESLAYVIYTSGSTGAPKGAELCHGGLSNIVAWNRSYYDLRPTDRVSMVASPGFDASIWEMWPALSAGASLHLPSREVVHSPPAFLPWAAKEGITVAFLPTPLAEAVLDEPVPAGLRLRVLQTAGDRLLRRPAPDLPFQLSNVYGPTEASIVVTAGPVSPQGERPPHIGRPVRNLRAHVLGPDLYPATEGAEGELYLGGVGVGRGYRRRPDLTAELFVPDPFSPAGGERLYRTGDRVRRLPSGDLEFVGRSDHQVKIRGHRIELGEIEAALVRHPAVREAVVLAREGRLVGCVVPWPGGACDAEDLRGFLGISLPEIMIPAAWVFLDAFPLTTNGKVDRKALAQIEPAFAAGRAAVPPRTTVEAVVAGIWEEVLGLGPVGVEDDFFALGGHSLLASRVASRVRDACGADPGVRGLFDHPTVAALAAWVERQEGRPVAAESLFGIEVSGAAPLSFAQQRLWFVERLRPGTAVYNLAQTVDLRGGLSASALLSAFAAVILRHDALRTTFAPGPDGDPVQIVGASLDGPPLPVVDFQGLPDGRRRGAAERICREEARRPYDLERGPLIRSALLALASGEHRLFVGLHHIVSDAWSIGVLMNELSALYRGADLPPLPVQYPAYAVWQRRRLADDSVALRVAWWRAHLEGAPDVLELPADRLRPATPSLRGERLRLDLGPEIEEALAAWSRDRGATLFMTLLAAFQILVGRFTGQDDFVLGTPVAGRDRPELEGMIGFFVNLLPLRARVVAGTTFRGLVAAVRESVLAAFAHQDLPFDRLVEELAPVRDASRAPLVQVVFAIQDAPAGPDLGALGPQVTAAAEVDTGASELDFVLFMERAGPKGPGLAAIAEHATDLFDPGTVGRLLANFKTLLTGIVADPERAVDELPLLSAEERDQAISAWNRTEVPLTSLSVDRRFEEHARRAPGALAVSAGEISWTYAELSSRAASVTRRLLHLGAGPETLVGLLLERSPELIVAVVATLESGAAYLPVDPAWPAERVEQILRDAGIRTLLSTGSLLELFSGLSGLSVPIVLLDSIGGNPEPGEAPVARPAEPDNLAYVIYTSGSTGAPKGAELCHRGLSNLASWSVRRGGLGPGERVSMVAAPGFDASVWEIWPALSAGASLHPAPPEVVLRPSAFLPWAAAQGITVAFLPTPLAEAVLAEPVPAGLRLRLLHTGGDRLLRRPALGLPFELSNAYGPTECTVVATAGLVSPQGDRPPHIGGPVDNLRAYVLDRGLGPVPPGAPGELCLGGAGVARGYRRRPDLTAERFVPDPFGAGGERLYRTGDLARRRPSGDLPSGELEVLGRIDHQVKIRGHRIELGEIEAALVRLAAVREATVVVQEPEHRLVACVVPAAGAERTAELLRAALAGVLPQVMIPGAWVFLDALPLSPNGKVDRKALARLAPVSSSPVSAAPRTPLEAQMAAIWADLLGVPSVGVADDLFALGGHSLLAARLVDRVRARLGVEMPLRTMFEAPTVAAMAAWVEAELLRSRPEREQPLAIAPAGPGAPLSFAQQRLWFLDRLEPGSAVYNIPIVLRLDGALVPGVLAAALAEVVRRHEALRTTFERPAGAADPVQVIQPPSVCPLPVLDLVGLSARDSEAARRLSAEARRPFDLRRGPLLRAVLLRLEPERHQLLVNLHHIVADGRSVEILERELAALYPAFAAGQPSPLPELALQYPDFAVWQRQLLVGEELERQAAYWRVRLADPQASELPADRPRPAVRSSRGAVEEAELPTALAGALERLGRSGGATPFMTLLAGFLALLHRYTGQDDLLVGTPVAGRGRADLEGLIGFFVNTLPLRADLAGQPSFAEVVARVRSSALAAYAHQDLPFDRLVAEAAPERDLSRNPLFQVVFAFLESWGSLALGPGLTLAEAAGVHTGTAKFDLSFHVGRDARAGGGLRLWLEYATDLFDGATIRRLIGCFERLLEGAVARPDAPVATLPLLSSAERAQLGDLDRAEHRGHPTGLLHALFEAQARLDPEAVALVADGTVLTYAELAARSALLARRLRALGAGPEVAVAVCLERRADLVVTLLAVLRSGSFYVPIDPRYPEARRAFLVADSGARIVVTEDGIESSEGSAGPAVEPVPENLAYLIYTSGSTGRPKAVAITHASAVKLAYWAREVYAPAELRGVLACTAVTFDLSVFELFVTLAWGGAVILVEDALALLDGPPELPSGLAATLVNTVPSAMAELLRERALPRSVRTVNLAGEALARALSDQVYARPETERLYNLYGPSEDTTYSTWALVAARSERPPSIGRPVHDSRAYVVDRWLERLPLGVPGELCLAGDGLARGYLGRPELTAERFVPDPFAERPGERMYRTGDLAKLRPEGTAGELEYLGRLDQQVKIRGYRIELGEVESALARLPGVAGAAVLVRVDGPGGPGGPRLVAYLAGAEDAVRDPRRALLQTLPEPMVPSAFVVLPALPLTPHGKVDRRALARIALAPKAHGAGEPLRTPIEAALAGVWSTLLGVAGIGAADDFFALGGHSLLATRLVVLVKERLGVELPVRTVFQEPTIARLAAWIEAELLRGGAASGPTLDPALSTAPLSFAQERLWFLDRLEPGSSAYNLPVLLELSGPLQPAPLTAAVAEVVRRHAALRTTFEVPEGEADPLQIVHPPASWKLPAVDLSVLDAPRLAAEAARLSDAEAGRPFDLRRGPLLRTLLLRLGRQEHRLLAAMHHIVSDGWSNGVLVGELAAFYEAFSAGRPSPLAELPLQYPDFAVWQRRWLNGGEMERQLAWWRLRLADPPVSELPLDRPRPAAWSYRGAVQRMVLPEALALNLERLGTSRGATAFMTHLGAFLALLGRYTAQDDLVVGAPVAGRGSLEVAGLIGLFVNTLVLRASLTGDPSFEELLARVRESALAAYAHQDLPFEKLVAELVPDRDLSRNPLFQVMLAFDSFPSEPAIAGGLTIHQAAVRGATAKFDLTLGVRISGGRTLFEAEHSTDLFDPTTIARFLRHLVRLLEGIADAPERQVSDLSLWTAAEVQQLVEWNDTSAAFPADGCLHELVEERAARTPEEEGATVLRAAPHGRPAANTRIHLVDRDLRPVPVGVPGELLIGGVQVGRGFLGRPDLTAEIFVPDPYSGEAGARLYRTGDLARWLADGVLDSSLGRVDQRRAPTGMARAAVPRAARLAPRTVLEVAVAEVWARLLEVEEVGACDDFFVLGGHSLMAARLAVRLRERFRVEMPLRIIFQQPTVASMAEWIEAELRRADAGAARVLAAGLGGAVSPLSFAQQRLWFLDRLQPGSHVYNMQLDLVLSGPLRPSVLAQALAEVVRRHAALRTTFEVPTGASDPVQVVRPAVGWTLPVVDLSVLDAGRHDAEAGRLARAEVRRPFDLERWPLLRTVLLRREPNGHRLLGTMHHIVSDGLSMELLQRELGALCQAFAAGRPSPLPELPVQYPDFAVWQRSWLSGGELARQLAWWRGRLASAPTAPILELPADRPRPAVWSHRGGVESASLPADLGEGLERLGRRHGATPFMTLLGAFLALLHRVTNQDELVVGAPVAGRSRPEVAGLIGLFVNTLALRVSLAGEPSFPELLARVRETALQSYAYQDLPFEKLVAELAPGRDLSRNPLVQVVFALHDAPQPVPGGDGLMLTAGEGAHGGTAKFDLSLHVGRSGDIEGGLGVWAEYGTDLFDRATVLRLLGGFGNLLAGVFTQGETVRVRDLPLLSAPERAQVVREWSDTATAYPRAATIHGLFEEQARRFPDRVVLVGEELTYAELDLRAERLAARLRSLGVGPDERVGLFAERSADLIAALLGILKAGGAYLPLDPQSPAERLAGMLEDAEVRVLVVQEGLLPSLPNPPAPRAIRLPLGEALSVGPAGPAGPAAWARTVVDPDNLAYVMFTSGSTGRPKGVAVTHRNVVRLVRETDYARLDEACVFLQFAPVPFDASTFEIWGPLLNGGRLALFPPGPPDLRRLGELIEFQGVTTMFMTTGLFHQMVESHLDRLRPLRQLLTGGDVLSPTHLRRAVDGLPGTEVIAVYGPTEGTTFTTFHPVRAGDPEGPVPIGRPIANARAHVLDRSLLPAPVGVAGQLYIGGDGLARGYLARPDLTAEKFVPDSVGGHFAEPGARLYATGDLARWRPDGVLEFLGRADHQVKLRGFRIELGEIETVLTSHPEVEAAVVVAREDLSGDKRLVAYVVPVQKDAPQTLETAELRSLVELRLPAYMVPAAFVTLSELPLTGNGKIDRRALPEPEARVRADLTPPRTPLEEEVAQVWCEILGVDRVWVEDSFWDLGGHSLLATRILARLADTFGVEIPLQALFVAPTLGGFSETVGQAVLSDLSDAELCLTAEEGR